MRALWFGRISISADAVARAHIFRSKFVRIFFCAGAVLMLWGGFFELAVAQEKDNQQTLSDRIKSLLEPAKERVISPRPENPPVITPRLKCATKAQDDELNDAGAWWATKVYQLEQEETLQDQTLAKITKLQAELRVTANPKAAQSLINQLTYQLEHLKEIQQDIELFAKQAGEERDRYYKVLNSIPKACDQPQTTPQQPPANPPPVQPPISPPSGGGGRFAPRMLPPSQWLSGFYGGVGGGVLATIGNDVNVTGVDTGGMKDTMNAGNVPFNATAGFRASVYGGYSWSVGSRWLVGVEADVGYATNNTTRGIPGVSTAPGDSFSMKEDWDGSLRARFGYLVAPNTLVYGTAGLALQHISATITCSSATPFPCGRFGPVTAFSATNAPLLVGGTVGVGVEYTITGNLRLRGEYRFSGYGNSNATFGNPANIAISTSTQMLTNTGLLGLTYAFGPPPASAPPPLIAK